MKLAQLCEDKGEACAGRRPSASIWVLSSLGPGGTWDHTSHGGPAGVCCPLMVCAVQCRTFTLQLSCFGASHRPGLQLPHLTRDTFCVVTLSVKQKDEKQL